MAKFQCIKSWLESKWLKSTSGLSPCFTGKEGEGDKKRRTGGHYQHQKVAQVSVPLGWTW